MDYKNFVHKMTMYYINGQKSKYMFGTPVGRVENNRIKSRSHFLS